MSTADTEAESTRRHPICQMMPDFLDWLHDELATGRKRGDEMERWQKHLARSEEPTGEGGWRAWFLLGIARGALKKNSAEDVAETFMAWVEPSHIAEIGDSTAWMRRLFNDLHRSHIPDLQPRRRGRPSEPTVVTAVRVWTIDSLCELAGLTRDEAVALWNRTFPAYSLGSTGGSLFRVERNRVREHLEGINPLPETAPPKRSRGRPRRQRTLLEEILGSE